MRRTVACLAAASLSLVACIPQEEAHPVARALPTVEDVRIELPESMARSVGDISEWYVATRDVTRTLNGGTAWVLIVVHTIVQFPPTSRSGDTYTWGPWSDALDPAEYKLDVRQLADGSYDWDLQGRNKTVAGAGFESVIFGNAVAGEREGTGNGRFTLDFDAGARVNPIDSNGDRGVVEIRYDLLARHLDMDIAGIENRDGALVPVAYEYEYTAAGDGGGDMVFQVHADSEDQGVAAEDATLRSRWQADGQGRADLRLTGGDFGTSEATGSQCWNRLFRTVYSEYSFDATLTEGNLADCAFATADLPR
jgi:hypothetical protein